jgi:hypothetical protein
MALAVLRCGVGAAAIFVTITTVAVSLDIAASIAAENVNSANYPDWSGQWRVMGGGSWDPDKPPGRGQRAPLTPESDAIYEESTADQATGGPGNDPRYRCLPTGMPRMMTALAPMEFVITPAVTYVLFENAMPRRIFTDGQRPPRYVEPAFTGYSVGRWIDEDGDGRYDVLEVETRNFKGPRAFEGTGLPLHSDNQTVVNERIHLNKANKNLLIDEITTTDHALTRPWTVVKTYRREYNRSGTRIIATRTRPMCSSARTAITSAPTAT